MTPTMQRRNSKRAAVAAAEKMAAAAAATTTRALTISGRCFSHTHTARTTLAIILVIVAHSSCQLEALHSVGSSVTPASNFELGNGNGAANNQLDPLNGLVSQELGEPNRQQQQQQQVSHKSPLNGRQFGDTINDIQIECNSNNIVVTLQTNSGFNGMIYPKGLSKNSTCMTEYHQLASNITYYLPLKSCNTMSTDVEDGVEYFNTVMVQPHRRLVTNQGRGYHIRCRYQTKERTITNQEQQLSVNLTQVTPAVMGSASMPACTMRIYSSSDLQHEVSAENVRIGDELQLIITLDDQDVYGMLVTNCLVRDGMNWGEQPLIDDHGCPVDEEIMPEFVYAKNLTRASVSFQAHKFPYTSSVYYQCNVRLCFRDNGCQAHVPPNCSPNRFRPTGHYAKSNEEGEQLASNNDIAVGATRSRQQAAAGNGQQQQQTRSASRQRRWVDAGELDGSASDELLRAAPSRRDMSIEVSSGLHVAEREAAPANGDSSAAAAAEADPLMAAATNDDPAELSSSSSGGVSEINPSTTNNNNADSPPLSAKERQQSEREFCMSLRRFAIIVSLISLLLMAAIIILIACLIQRRNRQKLESQLNSTYDHHHNADPYAGPYSNRAYCRD